MNNDMIDISVEVQALNLEGIKKNLLEYVQKQAQIDIDGSVNNAAQSAESAETSAGNAAQSALQASDCAEQASESLGNYYTKGQVDDLLGAKQDTLVSGTNIKTINSTSVLGSGNLALADQSLSNLDSTGQMVVDSANGTISNCILDIPHTFTIEQSGNTFTLKSGSTVALVNRNTYTTTTITHDFSTTVSNDGLYFLVFSGWSFVSWMTPASLGSGTSLPADNSQYQQFFLIDGASGKYYVWNSDWTAWGDNSSYPLALVKVENGTASFAKDSNGNDMIFNGAGFIGHHAFVYPNVKALSGIGISTNGKYNSQIDTTNVLSIIELNSSLPTAGYSKVLYFGAYGTAYSSAYYREVETIEERNTDTVGYRLQYVKENNTTYTYTNNGFETRELTRLVTYAYNGTTVTDFAIRQPVRTATVEMLDNTISTLYPVGSVYIGTQADCPLTSLIPNSVWQLQSSGLVLQCSDSDHAAGTTIEAGLPEIEATWRSSQDYNQTGAAYRINSGQSGFGSGPYGSDTGFKASLSNSIYGNSDTVQPPALVVNVWIRTQ